MGETNQVLAHLISGFAVYPGEDGGDAGRLGFALLQRQSDTRRAPPAATTDGVYEHESGTFALHSVVDACWPVSSSTPMLVSSARDQLVLVGTYEISMNCLVAHDDHDHRGAMLRLRRGFAHVSDHEIKR